MCSDGNIILKNVNILRLIDRVIKVFFRKYRYNYKYYKLL